MQFSKYSIFTKLKNSNPYPMKKLLVTLLYLILSKFNFAQNWNALGSGLNDEVQALIVYNGNLIAAGNFSGDNAGAVLNKIAAWNGSTWSALGSGLNGNAYALAVFNGELFVGGDFTIAGGQAVQRVAKWNGTNWQPVGDGFNQGVRCFLVANGDLYAGGNFINSGAATVNHVAKWSAGSWNALGSGITGGSVLSMAWFNGSIYAGGNFTGLIKKYDGSSWNTSGSINGLEVSALISWGVNGATSGSNFFLWAAGTINAPSQGLIRTNDGNSWLSAVNQFTGANKPKRFFPTYNFLFTSGAFTETINGRNVDKIAKFSSQNVWDSLRNGLNNEVTAMTYYNNELVAAGKFTGANGSNNLARIARYSIAVGVADLFNTLNEIKVYPNPAIDKATIDFNVSKYLGDLSAIVFDMNGRMVMGADLGSTQIGNLLNYNHTFNLQGLAVGQYNIVVTSPEGVLISRLVTKQ